MSKIEIANNKLIYYLKSSNIKSFSKDYQEGYNDAIKDVMRYINKSKEIRINREISNKN